MPLHHQAIRTAIGARCQALVPSREGCRGGTPLSDKMSGPPESKKESQERDAVGHFGGRGWKTDPKKMAD
jgi:hypothetical protein